MLKEMLQDSELDEVRKVTKRVVRGGKVLRKKVNVGKKKRLNPKQRMALKKARRKAHKPQAQRARKKSNLIRKRRVG